MSRASCLLAALCCLIVTQSNAIELVPDYYEQAGPNPYSSSVDQSANENIDPFSGQLSLSYTDIYLPGNGGLDISVTRTYSSSSSEKSYWSIRSFLGLGWQMHMGRMIRRTDVNTCINHNLPTLDSPLNNPLFEMPSGAKKQFFAPDFSENYVWISMDRWKMDCADTASGLVYTITAPNGYKYRLDHVEYDLDEKIALHYVTSIEDLNGNRIEISYISGTLVQGLALINEIKGAAPGDAQSDGRLVTFNYDDVSGSAPKLLSIEADGRTWNYVHTTVPGAAVDKHLSQVIRPDGTSFDYEYYDRTESFGANSLRKVTSLYGSETEYTYGSMDFDLDNEGLYINTVVTSKTVSGGDVKTGVWNYEYLVSRDYDETTVTSPKGKYIYRNLGLMSARMPDSPDQALFYAIGTPMEELVYDDGDNLVSHTQYRWGYQKLSDENYFRPSRAVNDFSHETNVPLLLAKSILQDGNAYVTRYVPLEHEENYINYFDKFGNPKQKEEIGAFTRKTSYIYHHELYGELSWLVKTVKDEIIHDAGVNDASNELIDHTVTRTFDSQGRVTEQTINGVSSQTTYHASGNVHTTTDALGFVSTYTDYYRGVPRSEEQQVSSTKSVFRSKILNDTGTTRSSTDGENRTTHYTYDQMNRLSSITYPTGRPVNIVYGKSKGKIQHKTLTRGGLQVRELFNGHGDVTCKTHTDLFSGNSIQQLTRYNEVSEPIFVSFERANACNQVAGAVAGVTQTFDTLGRKVRELFSDGTSRSTSYSAPYTVVTTDERGFKTTTGLQSFSSPSSGMPTYIAGPEGTETRISRDLLGNKLAVWQGNQSDVGIGIIKTYSYNDRFQLIKEFLPETNSYKHFERDELGKVLSWYISKNGVIVKGDRYQYDGLGRLISADLASNNFIDESFTYFDDGQIKTSTRLDAARTYSYDANGNIDVVSVQTEAGKTFELNYDFNDLDYLESITYPSTRIVSYQPDSFGRATQVGDYVTQVNYNDYGLMESFTYANGSTTYRSYDENRLFLTGILAQANDLVVEKTFAYDEKGNMLSSEDALNNSNNILASYDGLDRLVSAAGRWGGAAYEYDYNGNILSAIVGNEVRSYEYDSGRKLSSHSVNGVKTYFNYDEFGSVYRMSGARAYNLSRTTDGLVKTLSHNGKTINHRFDTNKRRVKKDDGSLELHYVWAEDTRLLGSYHADDMYEEHIYLGMQRIATAELNMRPKVILDETAEANEYSLFVLPASVSNLSNAITPSYSWSQVSGPTVSLSDSNLLQPSITIPASAFGDTVVLKLTMTTPVGAQSKQITINTTFTDLDGDALSDQFEQNYFGSLDVMPLDDPDGDGLSNLDEFERGSDPTVAQAPGSISGLKLAAGHDKVRIDWNAAERATSYNLYWNTSPFTTLGDANKIEGVQSGFVHSGLQKQDYYYRVTALNAAESSPSEQGVAVPGSGAWTDFSDALTGYDVYDILSVDSDQAGRIGVVFVEEVIDIIDDSRSLVSTITNSDEYFSLTRLLFNIDNGIGVVVPSGTQCSVAPIGSYGNQITMIGNQGDYAIDTSLGLCREEDVNQYGVSLGSKGLVGYNPQKRVTSYQSYFVEFDPASGWRTPQLLGGVKSSDAAKLSYGSNGSVLVGIRSDDRLEVLYRDQQATLERQFTIDASVENSQYYFGRGQEALFDLKLDQENNGIVLWAGPDETNSFGNGVYLKELSPLGDWLETTSLRASDSNMRNVINLAIHSVGENGLVTFSGCNRWYGDCAQHVTYKRNDIGWIAPLERTVNYSYNEGGYSDDYIDQCDLSTESGRTALACDFVIQEGWDWGYKPNSSNFVRSFDALFSGYSKKVDSERWLLSDGTEQSAEDIWSLSGHHYYADFGNEPILGSDSTIYRSNNMLVIHDRQHLNLWIKGSRWMVSDEGYGYPEKAEVSLTDENSLALVTAIDGRLKVKRFKMVEPALAVTIDTPSTVYMDEGDTSTISAQSKTSFPLNYVWEQVSGPSASYVDLGDGRVEVTAPLVNSIEFLTFRVTVTNATNASDAQTKYVSVEVSPTNALPTARLTCRDNCYFLSHEHSESHTHQALNIFNTDEPTPYNGLRRYPESGTLMAPNEIRVVEAGGLETVFSSNEPLLYPLYDGYESHSDEYEPKSVRVYASKAKRAYPGEKIDLVPEVTSSGGFEVDTRWDQVRGVKVASVSAVGNALSITIPNEALGQTLRYRFKGKEAQTAENIPSDNYFDEIRLSNDKRPHHYDFVDVEIVDPASGPIAFTGENKEALEGTTVSMSALGSRSGEGQSLTYFWEQIEGPLVALSSTTDAQVTFAAPDVRHFEVLRFRLTVTDEQGRSDQDVETVTVVYDNQPPVLSMTSVLEVYEGEDFDVLLYTPQDETKVYFENDYYSGLTQVSGPQAIRVGCLFNNCRNGQTYEAPEVDSAQQMVFERRGHDTQGLETVEQVIVYVLDESDPSMFDVDSDGDGIPNAYDPNPNAEDQYQAYTEYQGTQVETGDPENPYTWEFVITGSAGNDYVNATTDDPNATVLKVFTLDGDDLIDLRQGVVAYGGRGNDTFIISGDYAEPATVFGGRAQDHDVLKFASGLDLQNIVFQVASNKDLLITFDLDGEARSVKVKNFFNSKTATPSGKGIDALVLPDGLEITAEEISLLLDPYVRYGEDGRLFYEGTREINTVIGTEFGDRVSTYEGDDILEGGPGNDRLRGGAGNDTYVFNVGDGKDQIQNWDLEPEASTDILSLTHTDKEPSDIWFVQDGEHIRVYILGSRDSILLTKWYRDATWQLDQIELPTHRIDSAGIEALAAEMTTHGTPVKGELNLTIEQQAQINTQTSALWQLR